MTRGTGTLWGRHVGEAGGVAGAMQGRRLVPRCAAVAVGPDTCGRSRHVPRVGRAPGRVTRAEFRWRGEVDPTWRARAPRRT
jgi:hypothetical protein